MSVSEEFITPVVFTYSVIVYCDGCDGTTDGLEKERDINPIRRKVRCTFEDRSGWRFLRR